MSPTVNTVAEVRAAINLARGFWWVLYEYLSTLDLRSGNYEATKPTLKMSSEQAQQVIKEISAQNIDELVRTQSLNPDVEEVGRINRNRGLLSRIGLTYQS